MDAFTVLSACPLFAGLNPEAIARLAAEARPVRLAAGEQLFAAGDAPDLLYIVATGRLRAVFPDGRIAGDIARLEPIGEIGLLTGDRRGASVHALRSSLLFAFSASAFQAFAMNEPAALMAITRVIIGRMREPDRETRLRAARKTRTLTVFAASTEVNGPAFAAALEAALGGHTKYVDAALASHEAGLDEASLHEWMSQLEFAHKQVVYDAAGSPDWTRATLRQADRIVVVADCTSAELAPALAGILQAAALHSPVELVLLRREGDNPAPALAWKAAIGARSHYFVRPGHAGDMASLARQLTGFGVGLVLGGGGARGFAHVGLLRAMQELGIPVDVCGGASMGAFIAALHASGRDVAAITETLKDTFMRRRLLNDYRLPVVSIIAGKKFRRHLQGVFGELRAEHLPVPFYCVSTNLTRACTEVHNEGRVADWLAASMCIPGLAPPVAFKGSLLCDGAVVNSLPTDVMQELGRGVIIASDVSTEGAIGAPHAQGPDPDFEAVHRRHEDGSRVSLKDVLFRTTSLGSESGMAARASRADMYLRMPVGDVGTFDWPLLDAIIQRGYEHAMQELPALLSKLEQD
ncbi:MAG: patatin-like phospholipase family protein [Moraxellaceae bacterium]|nr:patatin-like phospholipase family protein [Moraxellaceae bacterium]